MTESVWKLRLAEQSHIRQQYTSIIYARKVSCES